MRSGSVCQSFEPKSCIVWRPFVRGGIFKRFEKITSGSLMSQSYEQAMFFSALGLLQSLSAFRLMSSIVVKVKFNEDTETDNTKVSYLIDIVNKCLVYHNLRKFCFVAALESTHGSSDGKIHALCLLSFNPDFDSIYFLHRHEYQGSIHPFWQSYNCWISIYFPTWFEWILCFTSSPSCNWSDFKHAERTPLDVFQRILLLLDKNNMQKWS